jgi:septal ring factor EnvC (AmiA/AmiB activator)
MHRARALGALALVTALGAIPAAAQVPRPAAAARTGATEIERELARVDADEARMLAELDEARPELELTRRRIVARGRAYYRLVRAGLLPAGGGFDALVDHAARVERTRRALERDVTAESTLQRRIAETEQRLTHLRAERAPLAVQRDAIQRAQQVMVEADERRAAFARAFETSVRPDAVAIYGTDTGPAEDVALGFHALKGRLRFPVAGRAEVHHLRGANGPAVELVAPIGTVVRSVAAGRVVFADRQDDYGLTVILDHGDRYYSLYASLGSADARVGDTMGSGARIGTVGSVGNADNAPPHLYLELRHHTATLDPAAWLGL